MIKLENVVTLSPEQWNAVIMGCRNPLNSWERSDSKELLFPLNDCGDAYSNARYDIGPNDHDLMMRLAKNGPVHAKYRRMIIVYLDITAPLYWWKEFKTYRAGRKFGDHEPDIIDPELLEMDIETNSCSTMHKIHAKEFTIEDFSCEHLIDGYGVCDIRTYEYDGPTNPKDVLNLMIDMLNEARQLYLETKDKKYWWQMIQLLPTSYNQKRTVMLNYEVLANIYKSRKDHKLDEWRTFCHWIDELPYSELITGYEE